MSAAPNLVTHGELSRALGLTSLNVAAYDETRLAQTVLEGARTRALTGVSTSARLSTVLSLLASVRARISDLELGTKSVANTVALDDERLRLQLLERIAKARRAEALSGVRGVAATATPMGAMLPAAVATASTNDGSGGGRLARPLTAPPQVSELEEIQQRIPPPGGYVVPRGMVVTFASRTDARKVSDDDNDADTDKLGQSDLRLSTSIQQRRHRLSRPKIVEKRKITRAIVSDDEDGEVKDDESQPEEVEMGGGGGGGGSVSFDHDNDDEIEEIGGDFDVRHGSDSDHSIGSASDKQHGPRLTKRGRVSRSEMAAATPVDDMDPENYDARQLRFKLELRTLCKKLRSEASAAARTAGVTDKTALTAARDAAALKASVRSTHGPGLAVGLAGGLSLPYVIASSLLPYQLIGVRWLSGLRSSRSGGVLGDEMGLGKTVQVAALLGAVAASGEHSPTLIVCPATLVAHWVRELTQWWPPLRVLVLSGGSTAAAKGVRARVIAETLTRSGVLVTTYEGLRVHAAALTSGVRWGYAILDEGHRIRNPDAAVTIAAKGLRTVNRIVLSGAPVQNSLAELWSIFDFCTPGRLGTLPVFEAQFSVPIAAGGWTHATPLQSHTAYQCALSLRALIEPYLLRRLKKDVNAQLPSKTEQVLFCRLTPSQRAAYAEFLRGTEVSRVLDGREHAFKAVTTLRKLANDPGLVDNSDARRGSGVAARDVALGRSGKLRVLAEVLALWHSEGRRCLVFTQGTRMLDIIEGLVRTARYTYLRMDGTTAMGSRQALVDSFNGDASRFLFLLTTRVGGVGVNLIGADRVLIFDPDWNPSTDLQARERAWRLGQRRHVTIYRLIAAGTIEEKVYQRQIFKTALTARILTDPRAKRLFNYRDLRELFTLGDDPGTAAVAGDEGEGDARGAVPFSSSTSKSRKRSRHQTQLSLGDNDESVAGSDHNVDIDEDTDRPMVTSLARNIVSREAFQAPDDEEPRDDGSASDNGGDRDTAPTRPGASLLRSVIDARGTVDLAPSLDGLSANQRTSIISHSSRYVRSALRALQPSSSSPTDQRISPSTLPSVLTKDEEEDKKVAEFSGPRNLIMNRTCQTATEFAITSKNDFIGLGAQFFHHHSPAQGAAVRLCSEPGLAVGARSLILRGATNAFTIIQQPPPTLRLPIDALANLPIKSIHSSDPAMLPLPLIPQLEANHGLRPLQQHQPLRLIFRRRALGVPAITAALAKEAVAAQAQQQITFISPSKAAPSSVVLLASLSQRTAPSISLAPPVQLSRSEIATNVAAARAASLSAVAAVSDRQGRTFGGLLGVF